MRILISIFFYLFFISISSADLFVLEFDAIWCAPCQQLANQIQNDPETKSLLLRYRGLIKYDVDRFPTTKNTYKVSSVPYYIILDITEQEGKLKSKVIDQWSPPRQNTFNSLKSFLKKNLTKRGG